MKNKLTITIILIAAIVLVVNFISREFFVRLDFSEDKQYTLSNATKNILRNLKEPVSIKVYFSKNLSPEISKNREDFKEMLIEYTNISKGMLVYEFVNPNEKPELEQEAAQEGISPLMINVREKDKEVQQKAFMGAVISMGTRKEVLPFIQPGGAMEYEMSKSIKKISLVEKPTIGLLQGHGEPGIQEMPQAYQELNILYNFEPLTLTDTTTIPDRIKTIAIIKPKDSITQRQFDQLDAFLSKGHGLMVCINRVDFQPQMGYGSEMNTGLEGWLQKKGVLVNSNFVMDATAASVQVPQQMGPIQVYANVLFPYAPIIKKFAAHPAVKGLEAVIMQFVSSIDYTGDKSNIFTPLAFTSDKSAMVPPPVYFNLEKQWTAADFPQKNIVVAAALEGNLVGGVKSKMIVVGDGDFCVNGPAGQGQQPRQLNPDNVNMFVNGIDWLSDDTGLIELRTKSVTARPIKDLEDGTKTFIKYLNFLLPILLVVGYGLFRMQQRNRIRVKRMEENYGK
jgi:gliding-associated putative ABC transporter substrate-binding component GldG